MTCQGCRHFRPINTDVGKPKGACHVHPPVALMGPEGDIVTARPVVLATDWACILGRPPAKQYGRAKGGG